LLKPTECSFKRITFGMLQHPVKQYGYEYQVVYPFSLAYTLFIGDENEFSRPDELSFGRISVRPD